MKFYLPIFLITPMAIDLAAGVPLVTEEGYRVPQPGAELAFPHDHGSHPDFKIEWWYLTGHLFSDDGRRFGYQATFFRSALKPSASDSKAAFGNTQLHLAHMALADEVGGRFHFAERLNRGGWDAYAQVGFLNLRNGNWQLTGPDPDKDGMVLKASIHAEAAWRLELKPRKPLIRFGEDGTSRKGPAPEARSYYLTYPLLETRGELTLGEETLPVTGFSWMDHEIASSQLDSAYTGWDWIAIHLKDGWQVKAYLLRQSDGTPSPYSALIWIDPEGQPLYREVDEFVWIPGSHWKSPATGASYPTRPRITTRHPITGKELTFQFEPILDNQELDLPGTTYWEGAGRILDALGNEAGSAYLELVGYAGAIEGLR